MIYALKLLFVVLVICAACLTIYRGTFRDLLTKQDYRTVWGLVIACMVASYLCAFPPLFFLALGLIGIYGVAVLGGTPVAAFCTYLLLGIISPPISIQIGGVGGISYVLKLDALRVLAITLLTLPALRLVLTRRPQGYGSLVLIDLAVLSYPFLRILMGLPYSTITTTARSVVELGLDVWLPYYVATRAIASTSDLRRVGTCVGLALLFAATIGIVEELIQHNLFSGLQGVYGITWQLTYVLMRGGLIRVQAMTQQPIILGVAMMFGLGLWIWLRGMLWRQPRVLIAFAAITVTLVFTWSRGPWLAAIVMILIFLILQKLSGAAARIVLILGVLSLVIVKASGADAAVASALGFIFGGGDESDISSIDYRRELLDTSLALIKQSPWIGVPNYAAQMQSLKQGEGIIDLVNTYLAVMLNAGVVGLACFLSPNLIVMHRLLGALPARRRDVVVVRSRFAIAMIAITIGILFAIFTTSMFGMLPLLLLLTVALPAAWLAMPAAVRESDAESVAGELADIAPNRRGGLPAGHFVP